MCGGVGGPPQDHKPGLLVPPSLLGLKMGTASGSPGPEPVREWAQGLPGEGSNPHIPGPQGPVLKARLGHKCHPELSWGQRPTALRH